MLAIQKTTVVWKLPSFLKLLSNGGPFFNCFRTLDDLSNKLSFDDFINDKRNIVCWNSEVVGQPWITVPKGQVS